jgi:glycosyltransferase involved in cell wall biosynthesis
MRLLVVLNHLELGGSQLNALDFAVSSRGRGHDVIVFAPVHQDQPGPVAEMVRSAGLPLVLVPYPDITPKFIPAHLAVARALSRTVAEERIQLVHAYEPPLILDSFWGPHLRFGTPLVCTIYGSFVPLWLPRYPPLIVASPKFAGQAAPLLTQPPAVIRPPVNTGADDPALNDGAEFRRAFGLGSDIVLGIVCRLDQDLKVPGIELAMAAVRFLDDPRIRLVVTGDGPSADALSALAEQVNGTLGRRAVVMAGSLADPRPAYAAADIALGMGGSALRSMAFGKPLIVLGTQGFAKPVLPSNADEFLSRGFFGVGSGDLDPCPLAAIIRELADRPQMRSELGAFGRQLVRDRYSLEAATAKLEDVYATAVTQTYPRRRRVWEATKVAAYRDGSTWTPESIKVRLGLTAVWAGERPTAHQNGGGSRPKSPGEQRRETTP